MDLTAGFALDPGEGERLVLGAVTIVVSVSADTPGGGFRSSKK
jgi:hypothetical protein